MTVKAPIVEVPINTYKDAYSSSFGAPESFWDMLATVKPGLFQKLCRPVNSTEVVNVNRWLQQHDAEYVHGLVGKPGIQTATFRLRPGKDKRARVLQATSGTWAFMRRKNWHKLLVNNLVNTPQEVLVVKFRYDDNCFVKCVFTIAEMGVIAGNGPCICNIAAEVGEKMGKKADDVHCQNIALFPVFLPHPKDASVPCVAKIIDYGCLS